MPSHYLSIDVGSSSVSAVIIDIESKSVVGSASAPNAAEITSANDQKIGRSEWDLERMTDLAVANAAQLIERTNSKPAAIGITGQQQGLQLLDNDLNTVGKFISWQDQRSKDLMPGEQRTYLDAMGELGGATIEENGLPAFDKTGCPIVTGYTAPNLFWLKANNDLPSNVANIHATTAPEFVVARLTDTRPVTDPTDAVSWGVYDLTKMGWNYDLIDSLGLDRTLFSNLADSCTPAGRLTHAMARKLGIVDGIPVSVASGDHQCSFAGTVADFKNTVAVNIGTGGQASVYIDNPTPRGWLELRPYIQSGYLLAGVGVVGGRTFRTLRDFFNNASRVISGHELDPDVLYDKLVDLAAEVPAGAEGVTFDSLFTGSRSDPLAKAAIREITPGTFTPGHMARSLFEAMAAQLADSYREAAKLGAGERSTLVGSGNAIKLNPVLRESLEAEFGMPLQLGSNNEEAAIGAALCAAVADGAFASIAEASASFSSIN
jgi:sugar (pentulose or hexulose) kinase